MDALKAEVALKRKNIDSDVPRPTKYMRRGEIERLKEEQEQREKQEKLAQKKAAEDEAEAKRLAAKAAKVCIYFIFCGAQCPYSRFLRDHRQIRPILALQLKQSLPKLNHLSTTSPTRKLSGDSEPKISPYGSLQSPTRTGDFGCVPWSSSRKRVMTGRVARMTLRRHWKM
jgi:hypothetical protein